MMSRRLSRGPFRAARPYEWSAERWAPLPWLRSASIAFRGRHRRPLPVRRDRRFVATTSVAVSAVLRVRSAVRMGRSLTADRQVQSAVSRPPARRARLVAMANAALPVRPVATASVALPARHAATEIAALLVRSAAMANAALPVRLAAMANAVQPGQRVVTEIVAPQDRRAATEGAAARAKPAATANAAQGPAAAVCAATQMISAAMESARTRAHRRTGSVRRIMIENFQSGLFRNVHGN